jgi:hypothetical protein
MSGGEVMKRKKSQDKLVAWVRKQGRVTVAELCARSAQDCKVAAKRLFVEERAGLLVREEGGPGDAFYWRVSEQS